MLKTSSLKLTQIFKPHALDNGFLIRVNTASKLRENDYGTAKRYHSLPSSFLLKAVMEKSSV